ncbi:MAG: tetratricopeptide repeat protein [Deltaproteobacteria bacterium]|nr:tetratricopeptide repeat protein [Deltaproteobacteria bacterium]
MSTKNVFIPPHSNTLFAGLADILGLAPQAATANTRTTIEHGGRAKESMMRSYVDGVIAQAWSLDVLQLRCPKLDLHLVQHQLRECALFWDDLAGRAAFHVASVAHLPHAPRAFVRIVAIDAAIRLAGLRHAAALGHLEAWLIVDSTPADFLRAELNRRKLTHEEMAGLIGVSRGTFEKWFGPRWIVEDESMKNVAQFLAKDRAGVVNERKRQEKLRWLRRHYAGWRATVLLERVLKNAKFVQEVHDAFVRLTNGFFDEIERGFTDLARVHGSALSVEQRAWYGVNVALEGRLFSMLNEEGNANTDDEIGAQAYAWRCAVAAREPVRSAWRAALLARVEQRFIEMHVAMLGGVAHQRQLWERDAKALGVETRDLRVQAILNAAFSFSIDELWDAPADGGIVPLSEGPGGFPRDLESAAAAAYASQAEVEGRGDDALSARIAAMRAAPHDPTALLMLAIALGERGESDLALETCARAITLAPALLPARLQLGWLLLQAGRPDDARQELETARVIDGGESSSDLWSLLGAAYTATELHAEAYWAFASAVVLNPRDAAVLSAASEAAERVGEHDEARRLAKEARHWGNKIDVPVRMRD